MKKIGFVDNDLNNFHSDTYLKTIHGPLADRGYRVAGAIGLQSDACQAWSEKNGVPHFASVEQMAGVVDVFAILAPSTPETHLGLCEAVFAHGKTTFVDKTFAPDTETAAKIFNMAEQHNVPVQTTSALRTTAVQKAAADLDKPLVSMNIWAGGASFDEYGIHPVELAISCLGPGVKRLTMTGGGDFRTLLLGFSEGRAATIDFNAGEYVPFRAALTSATGTTIVDVDDTVLFNDAAAAILDFFDAGKPLVPKDETMAVMRVLDAAKKPEAMTGWIDVA